VALAREVRVSRTVVAQDFWYSERPSYVDVHGVCVYALVQVGAREDLGSAGGRAGDHWVVDELAICRRWEEVV